MLDKEARLNLYLKYEELFREFFGTLNFCMTNCINNAESNFWDWFDIKSNKGMRTPGKIACCRVHGYAADPKILREKRIELCGAERESEPFFGAACRYHTDAGCMLTSYRGPTCLTYACEDLQKHLRYTYRINYDDCAKDEARSMLYGILNGCASESGLCRLEYDLRSYIDIIKTFTS